MLKFIEVINALLYGLLPNDFIISLFLKSSLIVGVSWIASIYLKKYSSGVKHKVWSYCMGIILLVMLLPSPNGTWRIELYDEHENSLTYLKDQDPVANVIFNETNHTYPDTKLAPSYSEISFIEWLSITWIAGVVLCLLLMLAETIWIWRIRWTAGICTQRAIISQLGAATRDLNLRKSVFITLSRQVTSPMAFGYFSPVIVLPATAVNWDHQKIRTVLLHELTHIKRNDYLSNLLGNLVLSINWFNPLVWLANLQLKRECEKACDETAMEKDLTPANYALGLLKIARESGQLKVWFPKLAVAMSGFVELKDRIQHILTKNDNKRLSTGMFLLMIFVMLAVSTSMITLSFSKGPLTSDEIQELITLASDEKYETRLVATRMLKSVNDPAIIKPLLIALENEASQEVKTNLITAIGKFGDNRTFYIIASNLYAANERQKVEILKSLFAIGCFPSYLLLKVSLNDPNQKVSRLAGDLLAKLDQGKLSKSIRDFSEVLQHSDWSMRLSDQLDIINGYPSIDQLKHMYEISDMKRKREFQTRLEAIAEKQNFRQLESLINSVQ